MTQLTAVFSHTYILRLFSSRLLFEGFEATQNEGCQRCKKVCYNNGNIGNTSS